MTACWLRTGAAAALLGTLACARDPQPVPAPTPRPVATSAPGGAGASPSPDPEIDPEVARAWEALRVDTTDQTAAPATPRPRPTAKPAPAPSEEELLRRAEYALGTRLRLIANRADVVDDQFDEYVERCYLPYSGSAVATEHAGTPQGSGPLAEGRGWFLLLDGDGSGYAWQDEWEAGRYRSLCRNLWRDLSRGAQGVAQDLDAVEAEAGGIGVSREALVALLGRHRLAREP